MQAKLCFEPVVSTRQATFNLIRPVPLHTSLLVTCTVKEVRCSVGQLISKPVLCCSVLRRGAL